MPLFRSSASVAQAQIASGTLVDHLKDQYIYRIGSKPSQSEIKSWERSLPALFSVLADAGLNDVEVLLEYQLPLTSKRADVVICGINPKTGEDSYVVVELKQWTSAIPLDDTDDVVFNDSFSQGRLHPIVQVARYCEHLSDFLATFSGECDNLAGIAYLHNAKDERVEGLFLLPPSQYGQLFTSSRRGYLISYLQTLLSPQPGALAADRLLTSAVRPSKQLLSLAAEEVQNREQFILLDEQQVAFSIVLQAVRNASHSTKKQVIIVTGGPGSGKSVIALSLIGELSRQGRTVIHATGSSAFTQTLRKVAGFRNTRVQRLFRYYNQFIDAEKNGIEVLINDEAHRVKETSTNRWTPATKRTGRPQVEELIDAARVPVFLLDEHQVVRPGERGTVSEIENSAVNMGCEVVRIDLDGQFRCGGSRVYERWVLSLLGIEGDGPTPWTGDDNFTLATVQNPSAMESLLAGMIDQGYSSRISAGYCWRWSTPNNHVDTLYPDVQIGDWARPWNNPKDTKIGDAPGRPFWASDPAGFGQIGCIYTAQGFEYDYSGVIFGPDLVWREDHWVARPQYNKDNQVAKAEPEAFERVVKNTYKVLLTRGMRGAYLYSTDDETQQLFDRLIR